MSSKTTIAIIASAAAGSLMIASVATAAPTHDKPAGLVIYPKIQVSSADGLDTRMHLSNTSGLPQMAHCFYVNANSHCTNNGNVCDTFLDCEDTASGTFGSCEAGWIETNFDIFLTAEQPIGWLASEGLSVNDLPCRATFQNPNPCIGGDNNGTRIPPVEDPFIGELKCIQADSVTRLPVACDGDNCRNDLTGKAVIMSSSLLDGASYPAAGLRQVRNDGGNDLQVGGDSGSVEYENCAEVLVMDFVYDGATDPISGTLQGQSQLTLVPCTQDFRGQTTDAVTAQFLVYNEFEQRLSTSRRVECLLDSQISLIDTSQPNRSIFSFPIGGTITGQARIRGVGGGLAGVAVLGLATNWLDPDNDTRQGLAGYALDSVVDTSTPDIISLP